ncbi:hypothetical protein [Mycobacteroides abscessus]|uniref:hypothetical protein n=1 Tax=Mycobacteroides abscessus TaxID=36809 RepID=UPI0009266963|nr:hypothetical protein [Mycobacteroides abscessus]MBN7332983.1 hypothetical protein [Mycobacteroides abscessus subsp. abscessus]SIG92265.1 Uncharacterised protein [Mycobacteroides abscessus subsp. abscessus]
MVHGNELSEVRLEGVGDERLDVGVEFFSVDHDHGRVDPQPNRIRGRLPVVQAQVPVPVTVKRDQPLRSGWDGLEVLIGMPPSFLGQIGVLDTDASDDGVGGVVVRFSGKPTRRYPPF